MATLLREGGYKTVDTHDLEKALELLADHKAGLAIIDLNASEGVKGEKLSWQIYENFPEVPQIVCATRLPRWQPQRRMRNF